MKQIKIIATFKTFPGQKQILTDTFGENTKLFFKEDYSEKEITNLFTDADILLSWNPAQEGISKDKLPLESIKFMQLLSAGYDHVKLEDFPNTMNIAANQGAYAEPMAEHVVAMMLSLNKRLPIYHNQLAAGHFNQIESQTKSIKGSVVGIIGFGAIGKASVKLLKPFGIKVFAINSSGRTDEKVDFIGTLNDLDYVLKNSDNLLLSVALNESTERIINKQKLELMKDDAVLINVARGAIIDEAALFEHLKSHPNFYAGIDAWWVEPFKNGKFELHYPFFELPNLLGSPHNSALIDNALIIGTEYAIQNIKRYLNNEKVQGVIN
jgi:phosphoglycerate dehydrogenase-like enzyme